MQILFNNTSHTFAGSFKVTVYIAIATEALEIGMERFETLSGWQASRAPLDLATFIRLIILLALAGQAFVYSGISQAIPEDEDDDDL